MVICFLDIYKPLDCVLYPTWYICFYGCSFHCCACWKRRVSCQVLCHVQHLQTTTFKALLLLRLRPVNACSVEVTIHHNSPRHFQWWFSRNMMNTSSTESFWSRIPMDTLVLDGFGWALWSNQLTIFSCWRGRWQLHFALRSPLHVVGKLCSSAELCIRFLSSKLNSGFFTGLNPFHAGESIPIGDYWGILGNHLITV